MGKVQEADKNAEFRSEFRRHLLRFVNIVVYVIVKNLYLVFFVSRSIQQVDKLSENFLF